MARRSRSIPEATRGRGRRTAAPTSWSRDSGSIMSAGAGARQAEVTVSHKWILAAAIASVPAAAFGANKDMERLQVQVAALQSQLSAIEQLNEDTLRELKRMNEALAEQNAFLRRGVQDRKLTDEAIQTTLRELDGRISEIG